MLEMKNFLDSVISRLGPAEERIGKLTTQSRKIPKTRPKEEKTKTKKHDKDQRNQEFCNNIKRSNRF